MRIYSLILSILLISIGIWGQSTNQTLMGRVSFISSQNVYVKFSNTLGIQIGDTLFCNIDNKLQPAIIVKDLSSISCVGTPINNIPLSTTTTIIAKLSHDKPSIEVISQKSKSAIAVNDLVIDNKKSPKEEKISSDSKPEINGRVSVSSYSSSYSNLPSNQRFRYNFSLDATHIANTQLSTETYISFTHTLNKWSGINDALRIYSLAARYDLGKTASISLGRQMNPNMANIGAVDGLQFQNTGKRFSYGAVVGFRPDMNNYGFNQSLLQFGAFAGHRLQKDHGDMLTTVALFNQLNNGMTDRRFAYIQHNNSLLKNLDLFCSFEVDLYAMENNQPKTTFNLTSSYVSLRYKPGKVLSLSLNYDARKNIYYYETFKNIADSIFDKETRQGFRFQTTYRPFRNLIWGSFVGYRFPTSTSTYSANGNSYLTYTDLPLIGATATIEATKLKTNYLSGIIYEGTLSRDLFKNKLYTDLSYRHIEYTFVNPANPLKQNIIELGLSWRVAKKLILSGNFEASIDSGNNNVRAFVNLTKRF